MIRAGTPTAVAPGGTSQSTTLIAPIFAPLPTRTPPSTCAVRAEVHVVLQHRHRPAVVRGCRWSRPGGACSWRRSSRRRGRRCCRSGRSAGPGPTSTDLGDADAGERLDDAVREPVPPVADPAARRRAAAGRCGGRSGRPRPPTPTAPSGTAGAAVALQVGLVDRGRRMRRPCTRSAGCCARPRGRGR